MNDEQETKQEIVRSDVGGELTHWSGALVKRALPLADDILQRRSTTQAAAHYRLGIVLFVKDDNDGAIQEFRETLRLDPTHADAHHQLGMALLNNDLDGAIREYCEALRLAPGLADAHFHLGIALLNKSEWDEAIREYREARRLHPADAKVHFGLGVALLLGKHDEDGAIQEFRETLRLDPTHADADALLRALLS